jgi:hypothetical protein
MANFVRTTFTFATETAVAATGGTGYTNETATVQNAGNGWYRVSLSFNATTAAESLRVWAGDFTAVVDTETTLIYGAQLEAGSFATSYIPTNGTEVTREPDIAYMPVSEFNYNQSAGTIFVEVESMRLGVVQRILSINNSADVPNNRSDLLTTVGNTLQHFTVDGGTTQTDHSVSALTSSLKVAVTIAADDYSASVDGGTIFSETDGTPTVPTVDQIQIGGGVFSSFINGHIRSLKYWPQRLSDATLQAVTQG